MIKKFIMMAGLLGLCHFASAYEQKEVKIFSESMQKEVPATVITPDGYEKGEDYPVCISFMDTATTTLTGGPTTVMWDVWPTVTMSWWWSLTEASAAGILILRSCRNTGMRLS
jgi:hypothetical protein